MTNFKRLFDEVMNIDKLDESIINEGIGDEIKKFLDKKIKDIQSGKNLYKDRVTAGNIVALGYLWYFPQSGHHLGVKTCTVKEYSHICTGMKPDLLRTYHKFRSGDHSHFCEALDPLVYRCTRHFTLPGYFQVGNPGIPGYQ